MKIKIEGQRQRRHERQEQQQMEDQNSIQTVWFHIKNMLSKKSPK